MTKTKWAAAVVGAVVLGAGAVALAHPPDADREEVRAARQARHAAMVAQFDQNGDGALDEAERAAAREQHLTERFNALDADKNGSLSLEEFKAGMGKGMRGGFGHGGHGFGPPGDR